MNTEKIRELQVNLSGRGCESCGLIKREEANYCSLAHHFGLHSHHHGHTRSVEEHTPHYDTGTGPCCSAVLKKTQQRKNGDDEMFF